MRPGTCTLAIAVNRSHIRICNAMLRSDTVEPLIKDTLNKGHNINNLQRGLSLRELQFLAKQKCHKTLDWFWTDF